MKKLNEYNGWFRQIKKGVPLVHFYILGIAICGIKIQKKNSIQKLTLKILRKNVIKFVKNAQKKQRD